MIQSVKIKDKLLEIPIIQGGMGVGVSLANLAGNVMKNGGMGVLSMAHPRIKILVRCFMLRKNFIKPVIQIDLQKFIPFFGIIVDKLLKKNGTGCMR